MFRKCKNVLLGLLFICLLVSCLLGVSRLTERKNAISRFQPFFDTAQEMDVLFLGDSHMINDVFPMELWDKYGIASYNIASVGNTLPLSYWSLMLALDYASPRIVVMDIMDVGANMRLTGSSSDAHNALDAYPISRTKVAAIEDLMNTPPYAADDDGNEYRDLRFEYYFKLAKYHSRWSELTENDLHPVYNVQKGALMAMNVATPNDYDIIDDWMANSPDGLGYEYLIRIIETCQSKGIEILLTHLPYPSTEEQQMDANAVYGLAEAYGVPYIDFVYLDQVVDYSVDCFDSFSHLNPSGARKVTDYLGRYLTEHYSLPDRRQDPAYTHWNDDYDAYRQFKYSYLSEETDLKTVLMMLHDPHLQPVIALRQDCPIYSNETLITLLQNILREHIYEEDAFAKWSDGIFPLSSLEDAIASGDGYFLVAEDPSSPKEFCSSNGTAACSTSFGELTCNFDEEDFSISLTQDSVITDYRRPDADILLLVMDDRSDSPVAFLSYSL